MSQLLTIRQHLLYCDIHRRDRFLSQYGRRLCLLRIISIMDYFTTAMADTYISRVPP